MIRRIMALMTMNNSYSHLCQHRNLRSWLLLLSGFLLMLGALLASDQDVDPTHPALFPLPQQLKWGGDTVDLDQVKVTFLGLKDDLLKNDQIKKELHSILKRNKISVSTDASQQILLRLGVVEVGGQWKGQNKEAYTLTAEHRGVVITANTVNGLYYGVQTLRQLIVRKGGEITVATCRITDYPAFKIRGFMHDVGRNFQPDYST